MKNSMIIYQNKIKTHYTCPCTDCKAYLKVILIFYSFQHAIDKGWGRSFHKDLCPPDQEFVFVCPDCVKRYNLKM